MFDSFCDPVFLIDPEGTILNANGVLAARFDKQSEECIGANIYDLLAFVKNEPEIAAYRREKANEALMTGKEVIFKDVHAGRFLKHTVSPIHSRDGNVTNLLIFVQDISTRRLDDESAPQKELAVYNALCDTDSLSFSIMDANGSMIAWNQYMRDVIIGKTEDDMPGFNGIETIHPDDRANVLEKISKILNQNVETVTETRVLLHGGPHYQWQMIHGRRIMIDEKPCVMFIGIDVTDNLHVEDKLNNSSLWFIQPRESARVGIWQLELKTGKITWSDELWSLHGKEQGNCPPSVAHWISSVHPLDRNMVIQTITEAANNENEVNVDYRVRYPDGSVHWLMAHGLPVFDDTGHAIRYIGAIIDITERKHSQEKRENLQKQLQQSQTSQLVGQLAGGIAHDFNNMMAAILGNTELLLDEIDDSNPFSENLEDIRNSAIRAKDMVHQLLSFARQQVIVPKILAIDEAIANLLPLLRRLVNDNIQFEWHLDSKHVRIYIDPSQFDQIIANLFVNARDAISGKGTITVGSGTIHIKQKDRNTAKYFPEAR